MIDRTAALGPEARLSETEEHAGVSAEELPELLREARHFHCSLAERIRTYHDASADADIDEAVKEAHSIKSLVAFARIDELTRLCHLLEEALQELRRRKGASRRDLYALIEEACGALGEAFDLTESEGRPRVPESMDELTRRIDARVRGVRIGDPGEEYRVEIPEPLRRALTPPGRAALLSAMAEELPVLHVTRVLPPGRTLTEEWAAAGPPGMILARAMEGDEAGGIAAHYLTIPGSCDPYAATTTTGALTRPLRYVRRLKPGADPSQIRLRITPSDEAALRAATEKGEEIWIVSVDHSVDDPIREGRSRHVFEALRELGEVHQAAPPLEELRAGESHGAFRLVVGVRDGAAPIRDLLEKIAGDAEWAVRPFVFTSSDIEQPRGDALTGGRSSVLVDRATLHAMTTHAGDLITGVQTMQDEHVAGASDLLLAREALSGAIDELLSVPAERLFAGVDRLARDVSRRRGRSVRTVTEIEPGLRIPRWIAESLRDSILHLARNAVDHGIEAAVDRVEAGKAPVGILRLAFRRGESDWVLEVEDDGAGVDVEALRPKVPEADSMPMEELLFATGVSSRAEADDISGRGLGLGIVRDAVDALRGRIDIRTFPGEGTSFRIELPDRSEEVE